MSSDAQPQPELSLDYDQILSQLDFVSDEIHTSQTDLSSSDERVAPTDVSREWVNDREVENAIDELGVPLEEPGYPPLPPAVSDQGRSVSANRSPTGNRSRRNRPQFQRVQRTSLPVDEIDCDLPITNAVKNQNVKAKEYGSLVKVLTSELSSDRQKVIAILAWISKQQIKSRKDLKANDPETPLGYMKLMKEGRGTYAVLFALMSREAKIPTVIVNGYAKTCCIKVGEMDDQELRKRSSSWNLVFADDKWRIVHPFMVCHGLYNFDWLTTRVDRVLNTNFNTNYIFPDPKLFASRFTPCEEQTTKQLDVRYTFDQWKLGPYIYPGFQRNNFQFCQSSDERSLLTTETGIISFSLEHLGPRSEGHFLQIIPTLYDMNGKPVDENYQQYIFTAREMGAKNKVHFEVRLLQNGSYILIILVNEIGVLNLGLLMKCRLVCEGMKEESKPQMLPVKGELNGWGYGPVPRRNGLYMPSHTDGKIFLRKEEKLHMLFHVTREMKIEVRLRHLTIPDDELSGFCTFSIKTEKESNCREISINVRIPIEGEFALQIFNDISGEHTACKYLLIVAKETREWGTKRQTPQELAALQKLREVMGSNDVAELQMSLDYAKKHHISEQTDDVRRIEKRIRFLELKRELHEALLRERVDVGSRAIEHAESSEFKKLLKLEIQKVSVMVAEIRSKEGKPVAVKEELGIVSLAEICNMQNPRQEIRDIMKAICLLIGHRKQDLVKPGEDEWDGVRVKLMIDKRKTLNLMADVEKDAEKQTSRVDQGTLQTVTQLLSGLTEEKIITVGHSALPYYRWVKDIEKKLGKNETSGNDQQKD